MKFFLFLVFFVPCLAQAKGPRFWLEPYLMYSQVQEVEDISLDEGDSVAGPGAGLQLFGFFSQNFYLGVKGAYQYYSPETKVEVESYQQSITYAGPLIGIFGARMRLWFSYFIMDSWQQVLQLTPESEELTSEMEGLGYNLGFSFWLWPNFTLAIEYDVHSYDKLDGQLLGDEVNIEVVNFLLTFPFEL